MRALSSKLIFFSHYIETWFMFLPTAFTVHRNLNLLVSRPPHFILFYDHINFTCLTTIWIRHGFKSNNPKRYILGRKKLLSWYTNQLWYDTYEIDEIQKYHRIKDKVLRVLNYIFQFIINKDRFDVSFKPIYDLKIIFFSTEDTSN